MGTDRIDPIEFGAWLARERGKRTMKGKPLSGPALARLFNTYVRAKNLPVKSIAQQEISKLEVVSRKPEKAPKRSQKWWATLREFIEKGELDTLIAANEGLPTHTPEGVVVPHEIFMARAESLVRTPDGEVVGRIVWDKQE